MPTSRARPRKPGDHVDLLALIDVLAVPNVCGADIMRTSNFSLKPVRLTVFRRPRPISRGAAGPDARQPAHAEGLRQPAIKADRRCAAIPPTGRNSPTRRSASPRCRCRCRATRWRCSRP